MNGVFVTPASKSLARNVEIKVETRDVQAVCRVAESLASAPGHLIEQIDTFFVVPRARVKVRQFADGSGELIAYDRPDVAGPKLSSYSIVSCSDAHALVKTLACVLPVRGRVVKRRQLFLVGRSRVHVDDVEDLGAFVELETVLRDDEPIEDGEREARELMQRLGLGSAVLVPDAYIDLIERRATIRPL